MRRFLVIPIMMLYMLAMSGILIHAHYCGDELESWEVYQPARGCAGGECGDETRQSDGCCQDKVVAAKVSVDQNLVDVYKILPAPAWVTEEMQMPAWADYQLHAAIAGFVSVAHQPNAPPGLWQGIPLYKLHARFTYYG